MSDHPLAHPGRAGESGTAISLFSPQDELFLLELGEHLASQRRQQREATRGSAVREPGFRADGEDDEDDNDSDSGDSSDGEEGASEGGEGDGEGKGRGRGKGKEAVLRPFGRLSRAQVEALRYRAEDVAGGITKTVVREARAKELKNELLNRWGEVLGTCVLWLLVGIL